MKAIPLTVEKRKRSWCICAGKSVLGKFKTEALAQESLKTKKSFYEYWADSCSVLSENKEPTRVYINI
ncbi:hypothetical protein AB2939_004332 [Escherichia coli]|jgi:hypothetical protein|uniref:hypothetical protein n=1 Tax=Enterobacteriaceae TaxID=543 RepID=UPI000BE5A6C0|nr:MULTISPECIES: hypothetical protein [Enterobacteriaceae]EAT0039954.1 hypothetical protein [Salmonella enterica]EGR6986026.1 hypothetical protein [Salmonella enterica subsp. enterica serovar Rissen]EHG0088612.1 hypothetical protein [Salmonella enterica subsp. enterica serovar Newport]EBA4851866.1 hypothetical protein [Salmonella enterica]ECC5251717.1 hypothetical protein [Salmonella enterica]